MIRARRTFLALVALSTTIGLSITPAAASVVSPPQSKTPIQATIRSVGYGSNSRGGASGRVVWVKTLKNSGPGSLRAALESKGHRIVRFRVAGTIRLQSEIRIRSPYITVAGNAAPGEGIRIRGAAIIVITHDVILRYLRIHPGDAGMTASEASDADALTLNGVDRNVYNVLIDHVSLLWGPDIGGLAILGNVHRVTVQYSILGEGLRYSRHPEGKARSGGHSTALNVTPMRSGDTAPHRLTFYKNLLTTSDMRMPRFIGASCVDFVNNLVYNWGAHAGSGNVRSLNLIGNWFRRGPRMKTSTVWWPQVSDQARSKWGESVFMKGNWMDGFAGGRRRDPVVYASSVRCGGLSVKVSPVSLLYASVLSQVGARLPVVDRVDRRVISNVKRRVGRFYNGVDYAAPHPYWPTLLTHL